MRKHREGLLYLAVAVLVPAVMFGQPELFGYFESEADGIRISGQQYSLGYNKLRLDLLANPGDGVTLGANLNIQRFYGKTAWNFLDFLPEQIWQPVFEPLGIASFPFVIADTLYLDNVFLKARFKYFDLTVGKQQISGNRLRLEPNGHFQSQGPVGPHL